ncbi:MAG: hypothetical protein H7321_06420 [Bacteroidia bacterium]|nr:hypothetical protein [Bacteroidia bacterium]
MFLCSFENGSEPLNVFNSFIFGNVPSIKTTMFWHYNGSILPLFEMSKFDSTASPFFRISYDALPIHKNIQTAFYPGFRATDVPYGKFNAFKSEITISEYYTNPFSRNVRYIKTFYFTKGTGIVRITDETQDNNSSGQGFQIVKTYNLKAISLN